MSKVRTRFAPSPTGAMHVGNLRTALFEYLIAKSQGGDFVLRIEDTDRERYVEDAEKIIYETLSAVGLKHDEGPDIGGPYGPYVQSKRQEIYKPYAEKLVELGYAYYCFCSKERLDGLKKDDSFGGYDRKCRNLTEEEVQQRLDAGESYVIRQKMPLTGKTSFDDMVYGTIEIENSEIEDQILLKADGYPTYNFANVVDDHLMEITHVVRGSEYLTSTPKYNLLYDAFGWEIPTYVHLPLIMGKNDDGSVSKLSKRHGATSFAGLQEEGYIPECIINYIALLGWSPKDNQEIFSLNQLVQNFSIDGISKSPALFDYDKLSWMNAEYIKMMDAETFDKLAEPYYKEIFGVKNVDFDILRSILQSRITKFNEIPALLHFLKDLPDYDNGLFMNKKSKTNLKNSPKMIEASINVLENLNSWVLDEIHDSLINLAKDMEVKNGTLLWPVRIAASGTQVTPGGAMEILALLGQEEAVKRLKAALTKLETV